MFAADRRSRPLQGCEAGRMLSALTGGSMYARLRAGEPVTWSSTRLLGGLERVARQREVSCGRAK